jgi:hypothetical protein
MKVLTTRRYSELVQLDSFEDRYDYLNLKGHIGEETFGYDRWINQRFYGSVEWKQIRDFVILRDEGCDLGVPGYELHTGLLIHHMNPITPDMIAHGDADILNPEYLITTSKLTHNAIHFGDSSILKKPFVERSRNDTRLW